MCCFLRFVTCGPAGGLGAPSWSLHASFMGLSEAIFQNWLHLRTCWGARFPGWVVKGGSPGPARSGGRRGCAHVLGGAGLPPRSWPCWLSGGDPRAFYHFTVTSPADPSSGRSVGRSWGRRRQRARFAFCSVCLQPRKQNGKGVKRKEGNGIMILVSDP